VRLYAKIGTMPAAYVVARLPRRRRAHGPWVGDLFEVRDEQPGAKYERVCLRDIKRLGDSPCDPLLHYLERM